METAVNYVFAYVTALVVAFVMIVPFAKSAVEAGMPIWGIQIAAFLLAFTLCQAFKRVFVK